MGTTNELRREVGKRLRQHRLQLGKTQMEMAESLDIDRGYYGNLERGAASVSLQRLYELADALGVGRAWLLGVEKDAMPGSMTDAGEEYGPRPVPEVVAASWRLQQYARDLIMDAAGETWAIAENEHANNAVRILGNSDDQKEREVIGWLVYKKLQEKHQELLS